jgi:hypothetical protein
VNDPLRVYDPASTWGVPEPGALAGALGRLASDTPAQREAVCRSAQAHVTQWCGPERVWELLAAEVESLAKGRAHRAAA